MLRIDLMIWCAGIYITPSIAAGDTYSPPHLGGGELLQMSLSLLVVLIAIALSAWLLRRFTKLGGPTGGMLRILGGLSLGGRERVVLMQVGDRQILLGVAPGRVQTLYVLEQPMAMTPAPTDFSVALRTVVRDLQAND